MGPPEPGGGEDPPASASQPAEAPRYGRYVGLLAILILVFITINTLVTKPNGVGGISPGEPLPPFAVPLVTGDKTGDANVSTTGPHTACTVRKPGVLNICELYEEGPVVLVLFVNGESCPDVLGDLQALAPSFPAVRFAAVAIKGNRASLRRLIAHRHLSFPVGLDDKGDLAALYRLATCPQITFALKGGLVESKALLNRPSKATLRSRIAELAGASEPTRTTG
jgi:AhpC/TSA family